MYNNNNLINLKKKKWLKETRLNRCRCDRRPPVPKRTDPLPVTYPPYQDNYIEYNARHVSDAANYHNAANKTQVVVDSKDGHLFNPEKSGLVPQYSTKPVQ